MKLTNNDFIRLKTFMYNNYGINLENKKTLIETRLAIVVKRLGFNDFKSYIDNLMRDKTGEQASIIVGKLTTNFTYFMREEAHFEFLRNEIFVPYFKKAPVGGIKIWSAASSTGEELLLYINVSNICIRNRCKIKSIYNSIRYID